MLGADDQFLKTDFRHLGKPHLAHAGARVHCTYQSSIR